MRKIGQGKFVVIELPGRYLSDAARSCGERMAYMDGSAISKPRLSCNRRRIIEWTFMATGASKTRLENPG